MFYIVWSLQASWRGGWWPVSVSVQEAFSTWSSLAAGLKGLYESFPTELFHSILIQFLHRKQNCKPSYIAYLIFWGKKNEHVTKWNILFYNWLWFITAFWYDSFRSAYLKSVESACKFLFIMNFTKICISKRQRKPWHESCSMLVPRTGHCQAGSSNNSILLRFLRFWHLRNGNKVFTSSPELSKILHRIFVLQTTTWWSD